MTDLFSSKRIKIFLVCFVVLILPILLCFCAADETDVTEIKSATIKSDKNKIKIEVTLSSADLEAYKGQKLCLVSLASDSTSEGVKVLSSKKAKSKMSFTVKLDKMGESFLSSALALAREEKNESTGESSYLLITAPGYIENASVLATENHSPKASASIKGLSGADALAAVSVDAARAIVEASITEIMLPSYREGSVHYVFDGISYYFDGAALEKLDKQVRDANLLSQRVYLRTVITQGGEGSISDKLCFNKIPQKAKNLAPATDTVEAMGYIRAFYSFVGERYNSSDMLITDYIIGRSVNDFEKNCYAPSSDDFENAYFTWLSTASNILHSKNRNVKIYVSVDNRMRTEDSDALGAKVFLQKLSARANAAGNIPFDIAISLGNGEDLGDILSGSNKDIALINANSFALLTDLLASEELLYNGKSRGMIIDSLILPTTISEQNRAAYYAYTYYKACEAGFEAFFFTSDETGGICNDTGARRDLFYVMLMCGSNYNSQIYEYLGKIKNSEIPKLSDHTSSSIRIEEDVPCEISDSARKNKRDFPYTLDALTPIGTSFDARLSTSDGEKMLELSSDLSIGSGGVVITNVPGKDIIESGYIGISMSCGYIGDVELNVYCDGEDGRAVYIGKARVGSVHKTYYFNITELTGKIDSSDKLTLALVLPDTAEYSDDSLTITDISLYGSSGNGSSTIIVIAAVAVGTLTICGLLFLLTRSRSKKIKRGNRHD